jgi:hypothetical protein
MIDEQLGNPPKQQTPLFYEQPSDILLTHTEKCTGAFSTTDWSLCMEVTENNWFVYTS